MYGFFCGFFGYFWFCFQRYIRPFNTWGLGAHLAREFTRTRACTISYGLLYAWDIGAPPVSPRRRTRWMFRRAIDIMVKLLVCACSYLTLHRPRVLPGNLRNLHPLDSDLQRQAVAGIREDVALLFRPPHLLGGRGNAKLVATA